MLQWALRTHTMGQFLTPFSMVVAWHGITILNKCQGFLHAECLHPKTRLTSLTSPLFSEWIYIIYCNSTHSFQLVMNTQKRTLSVNLHKTPVLLCSMATALTNGCQTWYDRLGPLEGTPSEIWKGPLLSHGPLTSFTIPLSALASLWSQKLAVKCRDNN